MSSSEWTSDRAIGSTRPARPADLHHALKHAEAFSQCLSVLAGRGLPGGVRPAWLFGRDGEVRVVVAAILRDWSSGAIDAREAVRQIRGYVADLEKSLGAMLRDGDVPADDDTWEHASTPRKTLP
jgi:hypothetical protein